MSKYYKAEDVIRKRAEDLADTSYWEYGNPKNVDEWIEVAEMEFKDLPTIEVSEDAISREWVKGICEIMLDEEMLGHMLGHIEDAPSVVPTAEDCSVVAERKRGEWKHRQGDLYVCSACGEALMCDDIDCTNFCPNCGADMRGSDK